VKRTPAELALPTPVRGDISSPAESQQRKLGWGVRLFPIVFFLTYLNMTVLLFAYGPWPYPVWDGTELYTFLALAHLALLVGYLSAAFREPRGYFGRWKVERVVGISLIVNLLVLFPTAALYTGRTIPDVMSGIANPGEAYLASQAIRQDTVPIIAYLRIFVGPFIYMLLPLTVFYWSRLIPAVRALAVFSILGVLVTFVAMGTNKAIADTVLLVPWLVLAGHLSGVSRLDRIRKATVIVGSIIASGLFLSFFTATMSTRSGSPGSTGYFSTIGIFADRDNILVRDLAPTLQVGALGLTGYLTHGYYALYLSMREPFVPMFGVGNSMFLFRQAARITGNKEIMDLPYPVRIEKYGWDAYGLWSSIYPWIASDVSFPGTIFVVFLIGRLFALSWMDSLKGSNPFAVAMFAQFLIMLFYFSANNQCLQSGEGVTAFWGILLLWWFTRRGYAWGAESW